MGEPQSRSGQHPATFALEGRHAVAQAAALRFEPPIITDAEREVVEELAARVGRRTCVPHQPGNAFSKPLSTMLDPLGKPPSYFPINGLAGQQIFDGFMAAQGGRREAQFYEYVTAIHVATYLSDARIALQRDIETFIQVLAKGDGLSAADLDVQMDDHLERLGGIYATLAGALRMQEDRISTLQASMRAKTPNATAADKTYARMKMADEALRLSGVDFTTDRANKEHQLYRTTQHAADVTALAKANAVQAYRTGGRGPTAYQVDQAGDAKKK